MAKKMTTLGDLTFRFRSEGTTIETHTDGELIALVKTGWGLPDIDVYARLFVACVNAFLAAAKGNISEAIALAEASGGRDPLDRPNTRMTRQGREGNSD